MVGTNKTGRTQQPPPDPWELWKDLGLSAATGARSGLEGIVGGGGDLQHMAAALINRSLGLNRTPEQTVQDFSPVPWLPTSEDVGGVTDRAVNWMSPAVQEATRHTPTTPGGQLMDLGANVGSGFVGGPETLLAKIPALKGSMAAIGAFGIKPKAIEDIAAFKPWESKTGLFHAPEGTPNVPQFDLKRYDPARGTPKDIAELAASPDVRDVLAQFIARGKQLGGQYWYNAQQLADRWRGQLGREEGTRRFNQNIDLTGATSAQSDVPTNIRNASWYQQRDMQGLPPAKADEPNPYPYGHFAQKTHKPIVERMLQPGAEWDPVSHDKMAGYTSGLKGNETPVAVDLHATRLPAMISGDPRYLLNSFKADKTAEAISPRKLVESGKVSMDEALKNPVWWLDQPTKAAYPAMERMWQEVSHDVGMTPAQGQASGWVGGGSVTGSKAYNETNEAAKQMAVPFIGVYDDVLARTAKQLGMDPEDVLKAVMRGELALR